MNIPSKIVVVVIDKITALAKARVRVDRINKVIKEIYKEQEHWTKVQRAQSLKEQLEALKKQMDHLEQQIEPSLDQRLQYPGI